MAILTWQSADHHGTWQSVSEGMEEHAQTRRRETNLESSLDRQRKSSGWATPTTSRTSRENRPKPAARFCSCRDQHHRTAPLHIPPRHPPTHTNPPQNAGWSFFRRACAPVHAHRPFPAHLQTRIRELHQLQPCIKNILEWDAMRRHTQYK